jgi:hypothetical protein
LGTFFEAQILIKVVISWCPATPKQ